MLQRIQSIFLALTAILMIALNFFTYWKVILSDGSGSIYLSATQMTKIITEETDIQYWPYVIVAGLSLLAAGVAIYEMIRYDNRLMQIKLGALNSLLMAGTLVSMILLERSLSETFPGEQSFLSGVFFPISAMICNILANRFIRKDENLVRSADRMR
jgi:hypothetical protein